MISENFSRSEFSCGCGCGFDVVDVELLAALETVRGYFRMPVRVTSGARCKAHNRQVGGSKSSQHILGKAADIRVDQVPSTDVYAFLDEQYPDKYGLGLYSGWVHIDSRANKARWGEK